MSRTYRRKSASWLLVKEIYTQKSDGKFEKRSKNFKVEIADDFVFEEVDFFITKSYSLIARITLDPNWKQIRAVFRSDKGGHHRYESILWDFRNIRNRQARARQASEFHRYLKNPDYEVFGIFSQSSMWDYYY